MLDEIVGELAHVESRRKAMASDCPLCMKNRKKKKKKKKKQRRSFGVCRCDYPSDTGNKRSCALKAVVVCFVLFSDDDSRALEMPGC